MNLPLTDGQLLREFAVGRDQRAFRELVERHQNMVYSTALRRSGHAEAAADVAQNVFLALATKAARLSSRVNVGGWLYKCTLLEAARRQRDELRRSARERRYVEESAALTNPSGTMMNDDELDDARRARQLLPVLDEAMSGLQQQDREALVLRFMQGLSLRETGAALGTTEEAARKRISRALEKLSALFRRRGVAASAALLAGVVLPESVKAAPAGLAAGWTGAAAQAPALGLGGTLYLKAAALTKTQVAAACAMMALVPVAWQAREIQRLQSDKDMLWAQVQDQGSAERGREGMASHVAGLVDQDTDAGEADSLENGAGRNAGEGNPSPGRSRDGRNGWKSKMEQWRSLQRQQQRDARLAALQDQLELQDFQLAAIAEATTRAETGLQALHDRRKAGGPTPDAAAVEAARDQTIAAVLDAEQWQEYEAFCQEEERSGREVMANRLLGEIQSTLHLTDAQKDALFAVFAADAGLAARTQGAFPVETVNEELNEKMAGIFNEEQWRLWQQRTGVWAQLFGSGSRPAHRPD